MTNDSYLFKLGYSTYFTNQFSQIRPKHGKDRFEEIRLIKLGKLNAFAIDPSTNYPV